VYNFNVYTRVVERIVLTPMTASGPKFAYDMVMFPMFGLRGHGHVVVINCFFIFVKLIVDLVALGTYSIGTVMNNQIGLSKALAQKQQYANEPQETIAWCMHSSRQIGCVVWVDRKAMLLLSSYFTLLPRLGEECPIVPRWMHSEEKQIVMSHVHKGYMKFMRGVVIADQMHGAYTSQVRSHKWWHCLLFFLLDTSVVNSYILYMVVCK